MVQNFCGNLNFNGQGEIHWKRFKMMILKLKGKVKVYTMSIKGGIFERLESLISDWKRIKRVVAWIVKYNKILTWRIRQNSTKVLPTKGLDVSLLEEAQQEIFGLHQQQAFKEEAETFMPSGNGDRKILMKRISVYKIDPFIDESWSWRKADEFKFVFHWCSPNIPWQK